MPSALHQEIKQSKPFQPTFPTFFISHGGGPWPWMKKEMNGVFDQLEVSLREMPEEVGATPKAILVISGHWETSDFAVQANPAPPMLYDYGGFPAFTYQVQYPAPGSPELAGRVKDLLGDAGFPTTFDEKRGFDHGVFCPFAVAYPKADIPVVQLSIRVDYDPAAHLAAGRALAPLRNEGVLIVGSGLTYHNLRQFNPAGGPASHAFDEWLTDALCKSPFEERRARLTRWAQAPAARQCHPQEDHLIPLMVAVGAAGDEQGTRIYHEDHLLGGLAVSGYRFGDRVAM